jgi:hypothetical protein
MVAMKLDTKRITQTLRIGLLMIAALALSTALASAQVIAQADGGTGDVAAPAATQPEQQPDPAQEAHDAADAAQSALDDATSARDQLESDGASQDQIDSANEAIARARADKEAADEASEKADDGQ